LVPDSRLLPLFSADRSPKARTPTLLARADEVIE
jgi:hypothetical protein